MKSATLHTDLLALGRYWSASVEYTWWPAEPLTLDHPGCDEEIEITALWVEGEPCTVDALEDEEHAQIIKAIKESRKWVDE
jgi:hypothetical protein